MLPGGIKVALLPKKTRGGTVVANLTIRFGDEKSLIGKATIAGITGGMLMRGTKNHTRQQIQDEMDKLKAQINVTAAPPAPPRASRPSKPICPRRCAWR